jgi:hypothetical protein
MSEVPSEPASILCDFRSAARSRVTAEGATATSLTSARAAADAERRKGEDDARRRLERALPKTEEQAKLDRSQTQEAAGRLLERMEGQIQTSRSMLEAGRDLLRHPDLRTVDGSSGFLDDVRPTSQHGLTQADPRRVLDESVGLTQTAAEQLRAAASALRQARISRQHARTRAVGLVIVTAIILAVGGFYGFSWWQLESTYQAASGRMAAGDFLRSGISLDT